MEYNIVIVGAGQLGSRYLQGLAAYPDPLNIQVIDINQVSLDKAIDIWVKTANSESHSLKLSTVFNTIPSHIDLAIISTSSNVREPVIQLMKLRSVIDHWLLEKILAQSEEAVNRIENLIGTESKAWVNTFFRTVPWFQEIKRMSHNGIIEVRVTGGNWGIACNTIHVLDFVAWWTGESLKSFDVSGLEKTWHPAKRQGFWEIKGCMKANFSNGSTAILLSDESTDPFEITIKTQFEEWVVEWDNHIARRTDGFVLPGNTMFQSERTKDLVANILLRNQSTLPTLKMSAVLHRPFLNILLDHWNKDRLEKQDFLPIT